MSNIKENGYVHIQPRKNNIDIYRISSNPGVIKQETLNPICAEEELEYRLKSSLNNKRESDIFLGINVVTATILFIESLKRESKLLSVATLGSLLTTIYLSKTRSHHKNESEWTEKEIIALEEYDDSK